MQSQNRKITLTFESLSPKVLLSGGVAPPGDWIGPGDGGAYYGPDLLTGSPTMNDIYGLMDSGNVTADGHLSPYNPADNWVGPNDGGAYFGPPLLPTAPIVP